MADPRRSVPEDAPGDFFVDASCIDCGTCRWMAPGVFGAAATSAYVARQPAADEDVHAARMALLACPTGSIGTRARHDLGAARAAFPTAIDGPVHHAGYHAESSFGATAYFVRREDGNVLVDCPRFTRPLVARFEELGGVARILLTHRDDVADHAKYAAQFGCERVLHARDVTRGTRDVERVLEGDDPIALDDDFVAIPVPGHTAGSVCFLHREKHLFTGDHLAARGDGTLIAFDDACWYDWGTQVRSMERLAHHPFEWVLPGHGRRTRLAPGTARDEVLRLVQRMQHAST